jgi:hypothetical protein
MTATPNPAVSAKACEPDRGRPQALAARWYHDLGRAGFVIAAIVAFIHTTRTTIKLIVTQPFDQWIPVFGLDLLVDLLTGCAILLAAVWAVHRVPRRGLRQYAAVFVGVALAALIPIVLRELAGFLLDEHWQPLPLWYFASLWAEYAGLGLLVVSAWLYARAEAEQSAAVEQIAVDSARLDQQTAEARLQMLEAQIEPHFLFNTLAHVKRLYETDAANGARMLGNLKAYLAVALPQLRETESTLGREIAHATAYLNIQQVRMGRRLAFAIDAPDALRNDRLPPLMLVTLVENAIKHGLGPLREGGRIDVRASTEAGQLRVQVADTGQGFTKAGGGGTGLANIRARLAAEFGDRATLSLALNEPRGIVATLVLPRASAGRVRSPA